MGNGATLGVSTRARPRLYRRGALAPLPLAYYYENQSTLDEQIRHGLEHDAKKCTIAEIQHHGRAWGLASSRAGGAKVCRDGGPHRESQPPFCSSTSAALAWRILTQCAQVVLVDHG